LIPRQFLEKMKDRTKTRTEIGRREKKKQVADNNLIILSIQRRRKLVMK
jgi:hypothetical protein